MQKDNDIIRGMIEDRRQIEINENPEKVFAFIETMPVKFPTFKTLEAKPFLFLRVLFVSGLQTAINVVADRPDLKTICPGILVLKQGDKMGSFTLTEMERPYKYRFTLRSFFFDCETGYTIAGSKSTTVLSLDLVAENPSFAEKAWWFFVKPIHRILADQVLKNIKIEVESSKVVITIV
jgi:hypothetical protein